jgi:preprotein translocase subunit SecA
MSLLDYFFGKPNFHRFDDAFSLDRRGLLKALAAAIENQLSLNKVILLVVHFPESFEQLQDWLDDSNIAYELVSRKIDLEWVHNCGRFAGTSVFLAISDLVEDDSEAKLKQSYETPHELSVMVCERHPLPDIDEKLVRFARAIPIPTQLGYFIAMDDPSVKAAFPETVVQLMKQFGMGEQEIITSQMLTKRLNHVLRKQAKANPANRPADSARQWLEINRPPAD